MLKHYHLYHKAVWNFMWLAFKSSRIGFMTIASPCYTDRLFDTWSMLVASQKRVVSVSLSIEYKFFYYITVWDNELLWIDLKAAELASCPVLDLVIIMTGSLRLPLSSSIYHCLISPQKMVIGISLLYFLLLLSLYDY